MKIKKGRRSEIIQSSSTSGDAAEISISSKKSSKRRSVGSKSERRRSLGVFHGLSHTLRPRGSESSNHSSSSDNTGTDDKSSLLRRFGRNRTSAKKKKSSTESDSETKGKPANDVAAKKDAGNTPKSRRIQRVDPSKVYEMLQHSPWSSGEEDNNGNSSKISAKNSKVKRRESLKNTSRKLKRSISLICGTSRSKYVNKANLSMVAPVIRSRRSIGNDHVISRNLLESSSAEEKENETVNVEEQAPILSPVMLDFNLKSSDSDTPRSFSSCAPFLSRTRQNLESSLVKHKPSHLSEPKRRRSLKRTLSKALAKTNESISFPVKNSAEPARRSLRRKSLGAFSSPAERRGSGIYASSAVHTPTFMTCGYVMTDSPPDRQDYNSDTLPWVSMKRKRRRETADNSRVTRYNAGHTPLPARKKRKSYGERLIE